MKLRISTAGQLQYAGIAADDAEILGDTVDEATAVTYHYPGVA